MLRVLCREDFSIQSAKMFAADLKMAVDWLDAHFIYTKEQARSPEGRCVHAPVRCITVVLLLHADGLCGTTTVSCAEDTPTRSRAHSCAWNCIQSDVSRSLLVLPGFSKLTSTWTSDSNSGFCRQSALSIARPVDRFPCAIPRSWHSFKKLTRRRCRWAHMAAHAPTSRRWRTSRSTARRSCR